MARQQELKTMSLLQESLGESLSQRRQQSNQSASRSMALFTLLSVGLIALLLMKCWL